MSCLPFWPVTLLLRSQLIPLWGYVTHCSPGTFFKIVSVSLTFAILTTICPRWVSLGCSCSELCFWDLSGCFLSQVSKVFSHYLFKFLFLSSASGISIMRMFECLMFFQYSHRLSILFRFCYSDRLISAALCFRLLICSSSLGCCWFLLMCFSFQYCIL